MQTLVIYGPQGCGKSLKAVELARYFGCDHIVDEWRPGAPLCNGALHLTHATRGEVERTVSTSSAARIRIVSFLSACAMAQLERFER